MCIHLGYSYFFSSSLLSSITRVVFLLTGSIEALSGFALRFHGKTRNRKSITKFVLRLNSKEIKLLSGKSRPLLDPRDLPLSKLLQRKDFYFFAYFFLFFISWEEKFVIVDKVLFSNSCVDKTKKPKTTDITTLT